MKTNVGPKKNLQFAPMRCSLPAPSKCLAAGTPTRAKKERVDASYGYASLFLNYNCRRQHHLISRLHGTPTSALKDQTLRGTQTSAKKNKQKRLPQKAASFVYLRDLIIEQ